MLIGLTLLYVGAVLSLNGLWLLGRIEDREIILINLIVATISSLVALHLIVNAEGLPGVRAAALTILFAITYLWVAYNRLRGCDGRGLGWFSLFVTISVAPQAVIAFAQADSLISFWLAMSWTGWAALWFTYFLLQTLHWPITRFTAWFTLANGVLSAWLPGLLILYGIAD